MVKMIREREHTKEEKYLQLEIEKLVEEKDSSFKVDSNIPNNGEDSYMFLKHDCGTRFADKYSKIKESKLVCPVCYNK